MGITDQQPLDSGFTAASTASDVLAGRNLTGMTALVTGGYRGLGLETTRALSQAGARVIVPARSSETARTAVADLATVTVIDDVDLADLGSVDSAVSRIDDVVDRIDILVAAAGVMATPHQPVGPGWDYQLSVNHLGHFALICRLYRHLAVAGARVVVYSSAGHHLSDIRWEDVHFLSGYDKWQAYGQSKTANILFALQLDHLGQQENIRAFSLHPGKIITGLQRDLTIEEQVELGWIDMAGNVVGEDFKTPSQGAATGLWAATSPALENSGGLYLEDCNVATIAAPDGSADDGGVKQYALDDESARRLWRLTAAITATDLPHMDESRW